MSRDLLTNISDMEDRLDAIESGTALCRPHTKWLSDGGTGGGGNPGDGGEHTVEHSISYRRFFSNSGTGVDNEWSVPEQGQTVGGGDPYDRNYYYGTWIRKMGTGLTNIPNISQYAGIKNTTGNYPKIRVYLRAPVGYEDVDAYARLGEQGFSDYTNAGYPDVQLDGSEWGDWTRLNVNQNSPDPGVPNTNNYVEWDMTESVFAAFPDNQHYMVQIGFDASRLDPYYAEAFASQFYMMGYLIVPAWTETVHD